jgi:hypothetical protein
MSDTVITLTATIKDKNGEEKVTVTSSKAIPDTDDFEKHGFRQAFHELEGAILETRNEVTAKVIERYLGEGSKKKHRGPKQAQRQGK